MSNAAKKICLNAVLFFVSFLVIGVLINVFRDRTPILTMDQLLGALIGFGIYLALTFYRERAERIAQVREKNPAD